MQSIQQQFLTWCRSKPADEEYDFLKSDVCAFYQFAVAHGIPNPDRRNAGEIPACLQWPLLERPWTFGALADRLESTSRSDGGES